MRFMIGYQMTADNRFLSLMLRNKEKIGEVYFAWPDIPSGRGTMKSGKSDSLYAIQEKLLSDLKLLSDAGIALNLLLNGHCYGRYSQARCFCEKIGDTVDFLASGFLLTSITTSSPLIAKFLKQNFPKLERRASVNMEIGTCEGMDYLAAFFDGYYLRRELNRNIGKIQEIRAWCLQNGKKLYALANSGCLNHCSAHNFHDNLVAHENEIREMDNAYEFSGICRSWLEQPEKRRDFLAVSNFIRPEDVNLYEGYFDGLKLATRVNRNPTAVAEAYFTGCCHGNLPDLLEPAHAEAFYPEILENSLLPADFGEHTLHCSHDCRNCSYCRTALEGALVNLNDWNHQHEKRR